MAGFRFGNHDSPFGSLGDDPTPDHTVEWIREHVTIYSGVKEVT